MIPWPFGNGLFNLDLYIIFIGIQQLANPSQPLASALPHNLYLPWKG